MLKSGGGAIVDIASVHSIAGLPGAADTDECLNFWKSNIPMGRVGKPEEIANAAVFLASDKASFMTGEYVCVDGGVMALGGWPGRRLNGRSALPRRPRPRSLRSFGLAAL